MPTWKCPKCGSADYYDGTTQVPKHDHISNQLISVEKTVSRCRKCDTMLGEKDLIYSDEEKAAQETADTIGCIFFLLVGLGIAIWWIFF